MSCLNSYLTKLLNFSDVAGKTGTTSYQYDRWFVGYTPICVGGIWLGYDEQKSLSEISGKAHIRIWDQIMTKAHEILVGVNKKLDFSDDLLIETKYCVYSDQVATEACYADPRGNAITVGYFTKSNLPREYCTTHMSVPYCTSGRGVAVSGCPESDRVPVGLIVMERSFPYDVAVKDFEYTALRLSEGYVPYIDLSEPYYKYYAKQGTNIGKGGKSVLFNTACRLHSIEQDDEENSSE